MDEAREELGRFFALASMAEQAPGMFSAFIDAEWHRFAESDDYAAFCEQTAGVMVRRDPTCGEGTVTWVEDYHERYGTLPAAWFADESGVVDTAAHDAYLATRTCRRRGTARVHSDLPGYLTAMAGHCPYLGPSMQHGLTTWSGYDAGPDDGPPLLALLIGAAERVRAGRRKAGPLVCVNIAVFGPVDISTARAVLDWPHWIARKLYAPVAVMVGKFWIGERERDRHGAEIAPPPVSFFSVRHSFAVKDARFLANLPGVAAQLAEADEDGRDVLMPV